MGANNKGDQFALYKGDELLGLGTAEELAAEHGVEASTIRFYSTPSYKARASGANCMVAVRIDDTETDV